MKKAICLVLFSCLSVVLFGQNRNPALTAYSVDMSIETVIGISCDDFAHQFQGHIDTTVCFFKNGIDSIAQFLKKAKYSKHPWSIDTRAKFEYDDSSGKATHICIDMFKIYVNGRMIKKYPKFYKYLYYLIEKNQSLKRF